MSVIGSCMAEYRYRVPKEPYRSISTLLRVCFAHYGDIVMTSVLLQTPIFSKAFKCSCKADL